MREKKPLKLKKPFQYKKAYEEGKSYASSRLVLYLLKNDFSRVRVGFSVSKRLGKAVVRNRIKRLLKEAFYSIYPEIKESGLDMVWIARQSACGCHIKVLCREMETILRKRKLLKD